MDHHYSWRNTCRSIVAHSECNVMDHFSRNATILMGQAECHVPCGVCCFSVCRTQLGRVISHSGIVGYRAGYQVICEACGSDGRSKRQL